MALITGRINFNANDRITAADQNTNDGTVWNLVNGNIDNANISASAGIVDTKLATITTSGKVSGAALTLLANTPSGAGKLPGANGGIPSGGIIMWSGTIATIPSGYVLCNGSNSTPDLRNLFVVGADADDSGVAKSTVTGSALQTSATGVVPAHTHSLAANLGANGSGTGELEGTYGGGHVINDSGTTGSYGTGTKVISVFYALAFIMKT